ncbi:MAG: hypothetical protein C5B58_16235 [Acidobacteria bacterium]|nr:MAG: hypothetical protein C5B58_16235 [Acidobacteriota bacterium]
MCGQLCKHRVRIMQGDPEGVVSKNLEEVHNMPFFLTGSIVPEALKEIARLEKDAEEAKRAVMRAKQFLADSLAAHKVF